MKPSRLLDLGILVPALVVGLGLWNPLAKVAASPGPKAPRYMVDPFWPKPLPDRWVTGEVAGTCVDSNGHLFIVNRAQQGNLTTKEESTATAAPAVVEFDREGNVVNHFGDPGTAQAAAMPTGLHGCFIDYQDNFWLAGNGDGIVQKYSHDGSRLLLQIGTKGHCDTATGVCGSPGLNSSPVFLDEPANMSVDPANGDIYIADGYGNFRVVVFDKTGKYLRQWGEPGTGPGQFGPNDGGHPHCAVLGNDDLVYACDRQNDRIEVFTKFGALQRIIPIKPGTGQKPSAIGSAWDVRFSPDRNQVLMFDVDGGNEVLWEMDHAAALSGVPDAILAGFGRPGHMAGDFTFLHSIAVDRDGSLFLGETIGGRRVQKFVQHGNVNLKDTDTYLGSPHYDPRFPKD